MSKLKNKQQKYYKKKGGEIEKAKESIIYPPCTYFQKYDANHILTQVYITIEYENIENTVL